MSTNSTSDSDQPDAQHQVKEVPRILIVDDEVDICNTLSQHLKLAGYLCDYALGANQAYELLEQNTYQLIISDIRMPDVTGLEMLEQINVKYPDTAVIMMTAMNDRDTAVLALAAGAYGYMTKPFKSTELIINVENGLRWRRLEHMMHTHTHELEERIRHQSQDLETSHEEIALRLIEAQSVRHDETGAHVRRIGLYAEAMARTMGMSKSDINVMRLAAPMHDVGKIGISDSILLKPGGLTHNEYELMKQHTIIGARILNGSEMPLLKIAREIAIAHHEHWDGNGYPRGISKDQIPAVARVVSILDVYDALVNHRIYRKAMTDKEAMGLIKDGFGKQFDPEIYDIFLRTEPELRAIRDQVPEPPRGSTRG